MEEINILKLDKKYWIAIICKVCVIATTFLITIFINRGLGVSNKGEYSYITRMIEMLYIFFDFGLGQTYSTFKRSKGERIRGTFITLALIHGVGTLIIGTLLVKVIKMDYGNIIFFMTSIAVMKSIISMISVIEDSIKRNIIISIINVLYVIALAIAYFCGKCTLPFVLMLYALNDISTVIILAVAYRLKPAIKSFKFVELKQIYRIGFITMMVVLLISINYSIDTIMLRKMSSSYYVGIYSVGVNFSSMFLLIPDAFKEVLFGDSTKKDFSKRTVLNSIVVSIIALVIVFVCFVFFGKYVIELFYGSDYLPSYNITLILVIGSISMIFFKILQPVYISHGKQTKAVVFLALSAVLNIFANWELIPKYNGVGAAIASALSYTLCGLLFLTDYLKHLSIKKS